MQLENVRIVKEMRNSVNRKVNCETANLNKTVSAAVRQAEDIRYIQEKIGLDKLPMDLEESSQTQTGTHRSQLKGAGGYVVPEGGKVRSQSSSAKAKSDRR